MCDLRMKDARDATTTTWGATTLDDRRVLAIVRIGDYARVVELDDDKIQFRAHAEVPKLLEMSRELCDLTDCKLGVTQFARQSGTWALARHNLQLPHWLFGSVQDGLCDALLKVFGRDE